MNAPSLHLAEMESEFTLMPIQEILQEITLILNQFESKNQIKDNEQCRLTDQIEDAFTNLANSIDSGEVDKKELIQLPALFQRIIEVKIPITLRIAHYLLHIASIVESRPKAKRILKSVK